MSSSSLSLSLAMATGEEFRLEKIQISGATLASLLQRFSTSSGHVEGFLFGHVSHLSPPQFSDSDPGPTEPSPISIVTVTSFLSAPATSPLPPDPIGWFSGRRRSPLRPSLREAELASSLPPRCIVFLLLASPVPSFDGTATIDTHEYRAYQFYRGGSRFVAKTLEAVNIGPEFRNHYGAFAPTSPFPALPVDFRGSSSSMAVDRKSNSDGKSGSDGVGEEKGMGLDVGVLSGLMGREAAEYTERLEDVYKGMLERLDQLAVLVHDSSAKVFHQENHNMKLRFKIAGLE